LIHIHGTENSFSTIISKTNIPIVVSIQGNIKMIVKNYCNGIEKKYLDFKDRKVASLKDLLFPWTFRVEFSTFSKIQKLETESLAKAKYIMGRTEWDKRITRILAPSSQYFHEDRILRKPFYAAKWMPEKRDILIVHTTNGNTFYKGFETICLTVYYLNKVGISFEWRVAGISENDLIVKIVKKQLKDKYPKSGLVLLGNLDENKLLSCMLQSDLYVMSSHIENNANNLYEAMIIGMPCISTFVGGIGSLIQDGITGVLIQAGDPLAMAGAVLELADNKDKALFLGNNARNAGLIRHDKMRIASDLINSYRQILHSKTSY
jgi:glycosyltransferase involved in cell wall biosynthesis